MPSNGEHLRPGVAEREGGGFVPCPGLGGNQLPGNADADGEGQDHS